MTLERRCKDGDVCMVAATPWHSQFEIRTTYPLSEVLNPQFFLPVRSRFRKGDRINIVRYDNDTWNEILEVVEGLRVLAVDSLGVETLITYPPIDLKERTVDGVVVARGFAGRFVVRVDGAKETEWNTLVEAREEGERRSKQLNKPLTDLTIKPKLDKAA